MQDSDCCIHRQHTREVGRDKTGSTPCEQAGIARERFFAQHGSGAHWPMRPLHSKETLKALRAAEMTRWERFRGGSAGN